VYVLQLRNLRTFANAAASSYPPWQYEQRAKNASICSAVPFFKYPRNLLLNAASSIGDRAYPIMFVPAGSKSPVNKSNNDGYVFLWARSPDAPSTKMVHAPSSVVLGNEIERDLSALIPKDPNAASRKQRKRRAAHTQTNYLGDCRQMRQRFCSCFPRCTEKFGETNGPNSKYSHITACMQTRIIIAE
jgi:hypothetical protein